MGSSHPQAVGHGGHGAHGAAEPPEVHKLRKAVAHMARSMGRYGGVLLQAAAAWDGNVPGPGMRWILGEFLVPGLPGHEGF